MKRFFSIANCALALLVFASCKKTEGFHSLTDNKAPNATIVTNAYDFLPSPTVKASKAENKITISLQVPDYTGRKIKDITKIAASTSSNWTTIYSGTTVGTSTSQLWSATPIAVNGSTYTFTTTFDEYKLKTASTTPASNAFLGRDFYFMLTLDNGETVITENIRVWVVD